MKPTLTLEGLADLEQALLALESRATQRSVMRRSLIKAAEPMAEAARSMARVDDGVLKDSIRVGTKVKGDAGKAAFAKTMRATGGDKAAAITAMRDARRSAKAEAPVVVAYMGPTTDAPHGSFQEFGTAPHVNAGKFAGTQHPGTAPEPFMRPAFDAEAEPTVERLGAIMAAEIDRAAKRAAKRAGKKAK